VIERELKAALGEVVESAGFRSRSGAWYRAVPVGLHVLDLQKSEWGNQYYVNLGIYASALGRSRSPKIHQCHFYTRAESLDPENAARWGAVMDLESPMDPNARVHELRSLLTGVLRFLESLETKEGVRSAAIDGHLRDGLLLLSLKKHLGVE